MSILNRLGLFTRRQIDKAIEEADGLGYTDGFIAGCKDAGVIRGKGGRFQSARKTTLGKLPKLSARERESLSRVE